MGHHELSMRETFAKACFEFIDYCPRRDVALPGEKGNWTGLWVLADSVNGKSREKQLRLLDPDKERQKVNIRMQQTLEIVCASYSSLEPRHVAYAVQGLLSSPLSDDYLRILLHNHLDEQYSRVIGVAYLKSLKKLLDRGSRLQKLWKQGEGEVVRRAHQAQQICVEVEERYKTRTREEEEEEVRSELEAENQVLKRALEQAQQEAKVQKATHQAEIERERALHQVALHQVALKQTLQQAEVNMAHQMAVNSAFGNNWGGAAEQVHVRQSAIDAQQARTAHEIMYQTLVHEDTDLYGIAHNLHNQYGNSTRDISTIDRSITEPNYSEGCKYLQSAVSYQPPLDYQLQYHGNCPPNL
ncbi:hypothetical protein IG631_01487 [Alternaria alternata]|nr:hypothetical protein IG631_01487 [Alternaria alternata]